MFEIFKEKKNITVWKKHMKRKTALSHAVGALSGVMILPGKGAISNIIQGALGSAAYRHLAPAVLAVVNKTLKRVSKNDDEGVLLKPTNQTSNSSSIIPTLKDDFVKEKVDKQKDSGASKDSILVKENAAVKNSGAPRPDPVLVFFPAAPASFSKKISYLKTADDELVFGITQFNDAVFEWFVGTMCYPKGPYALMLTTSSDDGKKTNLHVDSAIIDLAQSLLDHQIDLPDELTLIEITDVLNDGLKSDSEVSNQNGGVAVITVEDFSTNVKNELVYFSIW